MLQMYPSCFFKEENGYSVIFPDLNLATCGETLQEAMNMAVDCLAGYLYMADKEKEAVPKASNNVDIEAVKKDLEIASKEYFVSMITVDVKEYAKIHFEKSVKKTLTIPAWLNKAAVENNINFSKVLQEALKHQLGL